MLFMKLAWPTDTKHGIRQSWILIHMESLAVLLLSNNVQRYQKIPQADTARRAEGRMSGVFLVATLKSFLQQFTWHKKSSVDSVYQACPLPFRGGNCIHSLKFKHAVGKKSDPSEIDIEEMAIDGICGVY